MNAPRQHRALAACLMLACAAADAASLAQVEAEYLLLRELRDRIDLTLARGAQADTDGQSLQALLRQHAERHAHLSGLLEAVDNEGALAAEDARALALMRAAMAGALGSMEQATDGEDGGEKSCDYDAASLARAGGQSALQARMYDCFARAAAQLDYRGEQLDRLSVFARLAITDDAAEREALWRSLLPVWRAVNGDGSADSPYRTLVRLNAERIRREGPPLGDAVRGIGVEPAEMAAWLLAVLEAWRDSLPTAPIEPWDHAYHWGAASRALEQRARADDLRGINDRFHARLGADPIALNVQYDLEPRTGKDPVAFTTFGRRPRPGADGGDPGEPWVFAAYRSGGLGNLAELLHETGHAMHIAAIRTRPAFADWPDSDIFTEGVADLAALDLWTPQWQVEYLGAAADPLDSARERLASIMLDIAWSLFEWRMHERPGADPNRVWTELTAEYLRIRARPEVSWWAVRGQLIDAPGYMLNYAAGAILVADLRAHLLAQQVPAANWYARVADGLFRFGLERDSARVLREFLGRPVSPQALLDEIRSLDQAAGTLKRATAARHQPE